MEFRKLVLSLMLAAGLVFSVVGCASDQVTRKRLEDGKLALEQNQFDKALSVSDAIINSDAERGDVAAAHYLHGRAIEQRVKADPAAAQNDLSVARTDYNRALQLGPTKKLEGYIRASLANVDYFQDMYPDALGQWSAAYELLVEPDLKAWTLYRMGLCQQRMGRFADADRTFLQVQSRFAGSEQATRAHDRQGVNGFFVQLATFNNSKDADAAVAEVKQQGFTPVRSTDARGLATLRIGPVRTYMEAMQIKQRFAAKYPYAIILP